MIVKNYAKFVKFPHIKKHKEYSTINQDEFLLLMQNTNKLYIKAATFFGFIYGLRRSEIIGLKWSAFNFEDMTFKINHTVTEATIDGVFQLVCDDLTKNDTSDRLLPITNELVALLEIIKEFKNQSIDFFKEKYSYDYDEYIFTDELGMIYRPSRVTRNFVGHVRKTLDRSDATNIRLHDMRHSCVTVLHYKGVPIADISNYVGHSTIGTTVNQYLHLNISNKISTVNSIMPSMEMKHE